ncbi:hypothetical protein [Amycolatopsis jiangsuensis]|uniref:KAP NTPase domain-containing protein n=1 Tax=Amycolatopsis jiangsuensis TaxID=1181879 RepID=A0A840ITP5_9PSEU|nr:hypothetical protein [Amycolatopsis jiangsuensis]MBB4685826.1 hypothetical protein [Amycolatopsis jiangsuensis]
MTGEWSDPRAFDAGWLDDFASWTARAALESLVDEALAGPELAGALRRESLRATDVREGLLENESLLAKIRMLQDQVSAEGASGFRPRGRPVRVSELGWLLIPFVLEVGYLSLLQRAWDAMPVFLRIFAVLALPCGLVAAVARMSRRTPELRARFTSGPAEFGDEQLGLGRRRPFALREIVLPEARDFISAHRLLHYGTELVFEKQCELYEEATGDVVPTAAAKRLRRILERAGTGAIALGGQRGSGKTTAILSLQRGLIHGTENPAPLVVVAAAPANYDARDFVLHLHGLLCKAVLDLLWNELPPVRSWRSWLRRGARLSADLIGSAAVAWAIGGWLWDGSFTRFPIELGLLLRRIHFPDLIDPLWTDQPAGNRIALIVIVLLALRWTLKVLRIPIDVLLDAVQRKRSAGLLELEADARRQLDRIRYLQTHTSGWSGKLLFPGSADLGRTQSTQRAEQQLTHPEVVAEFRAFAQRTAGLLRGEGVTDRLVVAIDELDKIGEQEKAQQLVNDVKGIFGVPGCLYLVAVSDDAVLSFEQRGLAMRDAFDSAFSELVRLEPFTQDESRLWIAQRLPGVPEQFCHLGHCLSGGLPRDLRRVTIDMVDVTTELYQPSLSAVTSILLRAELTAKTSAFTGQARALEQTTELAQLWTKLLRIPETREAAELAALAAELHEGATHDLATPVNLLRHHSSAFVLFCATMLELFTDALTDDRLTPALHQLAVARRHLALDPHLAWSTLTDFRKAHDLALPE